MVERSFSNYLIGKNKSAKKKVGKSYWSAKTLVTCTKFSHFYQLNLPK